MAHFCYSEEREPFRGRPIPYHEQPAVQYWRKHYANSLYLRFIHTSPLSSFQERAQARKELDICDRKMATWARHPNWTAEEAAKVRAEEDTKWQTTTRSQ